MCWAFKAPPPSGNREHNHGPHLHTRDAAGQPTVGVYGVLALTAKERTREIGIRMALGADRNSIMRMLVWQYGRSVTLATGIGIFLSFLAARFLASLFGVFRGELVIVSTVCILMSIVAFAAVLIPSHASAHTSPLEVLRID